MVVIEDNIVKLFKNSKETWGIDLIALNESLGQINIKRVIFQVDSFSSLLFVIVLKPLLIILNEIDLKYVTSANQELKHLLFMDNLRENWIPLSRP